jgi:SAM-dependent methyltransferase/DNA-directed RNA polymerase subunit RPC12/RpoP
MARAAAKTKKERVAEEVAKAVGAGRAVAVETVDFSDPNRPKTCLEVDFPILPINQIAQIEGNAGKPIYQMSKWWARRRSSVFRSMLLAAAMKAPEDEASAAKAVWDVYYANHQKRGTLKNLKVADIFMGGGTTIVEGSRLGMQMFGADLNPVAWFVVKSELAQVEPAEVQSLLDEIEREVKPLIIPFYACDCPRGHKGSWTQVSTDEVLGEEFDPLALAPKERSDYRYEGPEIIYVFWSKHGPCQVTGCGHRTPIMSSPVMAIKTLTVKAWENYHCAKCGETFDVESAEARMAPGVPLAVAETEKPFAARDAKGGVTCPHCSQHDAFPLLGGKGENKKIELALLVHPQWLAGASKLDPAGREYGGSATDTPEATASWNRERGRTMRLLEVRGPLPEEVTCPETGVVFRTDSKGGTVPKKSKYACGNCGTVQDVLKTIKASKRTGPVAAYAIQGYCPTCDNEGRAYGGRFFAPVVGTSALDASVREWNERKDADLAAFWPRSPLHYGFMTHMLNGGIPNHGFTHWWKMFNPRQLLVHTQLLRAIAENQHFAWEIREYVLGAFQQYLRNQCMFTIWNVPADKMEPMFANNNFHPKSTMIENCIFPDYGRGNWTSSSCSLAETAEWSKYPWELVSNAYLEEHAVHLAEDISGKSEKAYCGDSVKHNASLVCGSATDLSEINDSSFDLVITDPPFGGLLHYSELSDFFYVWLRLVLKSHYPNHFTSEYTPKALEVVANRAREPENPDGFYQRLLTQAWREAHRILKPGGLLAFTFHHSEDEPWVAVLESLFDAGFYLEATYPIRSDETKGEGEFGSRKIEYDIIHVCRKRIQEPQRVSWGRMRREVIEDVRQLQSVLEHHVKGGLPAADLQVIKRGKALEYFSRHYGQVYVDETRQLKIKDALVGINQLLDKGSGLIKEQPPPNAEPMTRQLLRLFHLKTELPRDQIQKYLRGTGLAPADFVDRGWCSEEQRVFHLVPALAIAQDWHGKHKRRLEGRDYDQTMILIGACHDASGINAADTLKNGNFRPHPALSSLLDWHAKHGATQTIRNAAARAQHIYHDWERHNPDQVKQMSFFDGE